MYSTRSSVCFLELTGIEIVSPDLVHFADLGKVNPSGHMFVLLQSGIRVIQPCHPIEVCDHSLRGRIRVSNRNRPHFVERSSNPTLRRDPDSAIWRDWRLTFIQSWIHHNSILTEIRLSEEIRTPVLRETELDDLPLDHSAPGYYVDYLSPQCPKNQPTT